MDETIAALRAKIETAERIAAHHLDVAHRARDRGDYSTTLKRTGRWAETRARIDGLQTAVNLLERQQAQGLPY
jgi:hypothetical protein